MLLCSFSHIGLDTFRGYRGSLTPKAAARVSASSPKGDAAFVCYVIYHSAIFSLAVATLSSSLVRPMIV